MYAIYHIKDSFKMPPESFDKDITEVAADVLQARYEGKIDKDIGLIVAIFGIKDITDGTIYPGDPSTHHGVEYDALTYMPKVGEVVAGDVSEMVEFGAFVRMGPMDGLVHVSQIAGDFLSFDRKTQTFVSKKSGKTLKKGDSVYAKVSTVSIKSSVKDSKIALTMRSDGLGKPDWAELEAKRLRAEARGKSKNQKR